MLDILFSFGNNCLDQGVSDQHESKAKAEYNRKSSNEASYRLLNIRNWEGGVVYQKVQVWVV